MPEPIRRRFTLFDTMTLIAAAAVGLATCRYFLSLPAWTSVARSPWRMYLRALATTAFLSPLSVALLILASRSPRPRRLLRHPAYVVGLSTTLLLVVNVGFAVILKFFVGWSFAFFHDGKVVDLCRLMAEQTGAALACALLAQVVVSRRRPAGGWLAGLGWTLGACWITLGFASALFTLI